MKALYCTADKISPETGGGSLAINELQALRSVADEVFVLSRDELDPALFKQPDSPFLYDYFALQQVKKQHFDIAHFYSWTFTQTVTWLKSQGTAVSYMVPAHDRKLSVEEFQRLGIDYPYHHISDDNLFEIYSEGYRQADVVLSQSNAGAAFLKSIGCREVKVIPGGINWPAEVKPVPDKFDVAYVGAIGPDKGLAYLITAWALLNYPDSRLIMAGPETELLDPVIRQLADKGNFIILGRVADVGAIYSGCSAYIQPSVTECFALEVPEAMSYARPVIATEGVGASDLIEDGVNGFIVPIRNPEAIAEKIDFFYKNRDKIGEFGEKARSKVRNYTWDKIRAMYAEVFRQLVNK